MQEEQKLTYSNEPVYVRRLMGSEREQLQMQMALADDPDFDQSTSSVQEPPNKRAKTSSGAALSTSNKCNIPLELKRRSNRRQKVRGEKEFFVSSDMLLRDFKVKVILIG